MDSGSSRLVVLPRAGGGYELRETRTGPVLAKPYTKQDALRRATLMLEQRGGGRIVVGGLDHAQDDEFVVAPAGPRPRWYQPSGILRWLLPVLWAFQLVVLIAGWKAGALHLATTLLAASLLAVLVFVALASASLDRSRRPLPSTPQDAVQD